MEQKLVYLQLTETTSRLSKHVEISIKEFVKQVKHDFSSKEKLLEN